jgi:hypothetical protein
VVYTPPLPGESIPSVRRATWNRPHSRMRMISQANCCLAGFFAAINSEGHRISDFFIIPCHSCELLFRGPEQHMFGSWATREAIASGI